MLRAVAILVTLLITGCGKKDDEPVAGGGGRPLTGQAKVEPDAAPIVDAADIAAAYKADSVAASAKYAGKPLRVRLRADEASPRGNMIRVQQSEPDRPTVSALIPAAVSDQLTKGRVVVFNTKIETTAPGLAGIETVFLEDAQAGTIEP